MKIYICGDSFCCSSPDGDAWVDFFKEKTPKHNVINLASPGASNYLIFLQIKEALANQCDYIIYHATSSIRFEFAIKENHQKDNIDRYYNSINPLPSASMVCGSWHDIGRHYSAVLSNSDIKEITNFSLKHLDLPNAIEKNYIYITHTLNLLSKSNLKSWAWSRGGFEHKKFLDSMQWEFEDYQDTESKINLWDFYDPTIRLPIHHITDKTLNQNVCDNYLKMLKL